MSRMSRRGRRGRRGRREENIIVFDRKLKIVEIFSADVEKSVGRVLSSYDVFPFFPSLSFCLPPYSIPRNAVFISTNCSKRHREEYTSTQKYTSRPDVDCLTRTRDVHSHSATNNSRSLAHFASSRHGSFDLGLQ